MAMHNDLLNPIRAPFCRQPRLCAVAVEERASWRFCKRPKLVSGKHFFAPSQRCPIKGIYEMLRRSGCSLPFHDDQSLRAVCLYEVFVRSVCTPDSRSIVWILVHGLRGKPQLALGSDGSEHIRCSARGFCHGNLHEDKKMLGQGDNSVNHFP